MLVGPVDPTPELPGPVDPWTRGPEGPRVLVAHLLGAQAARMLGPVVPQVQVDLMLEQGEALGPVVRILGPAGGPQEPGGPRVRVDPMLGPEEPRVLAGHPLGARVEPIQEPAVPPLGARVDRMLVPVARVDRMLVLSAPGPWRTATTMQQMGAKPTWRQPPQVVVPVATLARVPMELAFVSGQPATFSVTQVGRTATGYLRMGVRPPSTR